MRPRGSHRSRHAALLALASALLVACGGDDASGGGPPVSADGTGALTVLAEDIGFPSDTYRAPAGTIDVVYENVGNIVHTLLIDGVDGFELTVKSSGDVDEGSVELDAGTYELYCDIPGHRQAGMEATLEVG